MTDREQTRLDAGSNRTKALADLRQAIWEADQFLTADEIYDYVESVLREIESDRP